MVPPPRVQAERQDLVFNLASREQIVVSNSSMIHSSHSYPHLAMSDEEWKEHLPVCRISWSSGSYMELWSISEIFDLLADMRTWRTRSHSGLLLVVVGSPNKAGVSCYEGCHLPVLVSRSPPSRA